MSGTADERFLRVLKVFEAGADDLAPGGGALCVYVDGEQVIDLWAGEARPGVPWVGDTLATLQSTTKGLAALCAHILYDRGLLDLDARVTQYWPEFGQAGKEEATVRQVLSHTVGVFGFDDPGSLLDWKGGGWDRYDEIAARLATAKPFWPPGSDAGYHAVSYGWLVQELVRRISGRTLGTLLQEEVAEPLGADVWIGTPPAEQGRLADLILGSFAAITKQSFEPETTAGAYIPMHGSNIVAELVPFLNHPAVRTAEVAGGNGSASARGIARVFAMLSLGGELDGVRIVSPDSIDVVRREGSRRAFVETPGLFLRFGVGYALNEPDHLVMGPSHGAFGNVGAGGQIGFCDPENRVAVGFVRNKLELDNPFRNRLVAAVYDCLATA